MDAEIRKLLEDAAELLDLASAAISYDPTLAEREVGWTSEHDERADAYTDAIRAALSSPEAAGTREKAEAWDALEALLMAWPQIRLAQWGSRDPFIVIVGDDVLGSGPTLAAAVLAAAGGKTGE